MKKIIFSIAILIHSTSVFSQNLDFDVKPKYLINILNEYEVVYKDVKVADNEVYPITATSVYFFHLTLGNNSKIVLAPNISSCKIRIDNLSVGENCEIIGDGLSGISAGENPKDPWKTIRWQATTGQNGATGVKGLDGTNGSVGRPLEIKLGILKIGNLSIHSDGGNGGNGGRGGNGQIGGNSNKPLNTCGVGGIGGTGGNAYFGNSGGNITVDVWPSNETVDMSKELQFITVNASKGQNGRGGLQGNSSPGGNGCRHGLPGTPGGIIGIQGIDGITKLIVIKKPIDTITVK